MWLTFRLSILLSLAVLLSAREYFEEVMGRMSTILPPGALP